MDQSGSAFVHLIDVPFDAVADCREDWALEYRQVEPGPNRATLMHLRLRGVHVSRERFAKRVSVRGRIPTGTIGLAIADEHDTSHKFRGRDVHLDTLTFQGSNESIDASVLGGVLTFAVEPHLLEREMGRVALQNALAHHFVHLPPQAAARLRSVARNALRAFREHPELEHAPLACESLRSQLVEHLVMALRSAGAPEKRGRDTDDRLHAARLAEDFALQNLDKRIGIPDLVQQAGVSERTLRTAFQDRYGHGPKAHLTVLRLNAARARLLTEDPGTSIAEIATRCGFWHLGRFAAAYRRHFGELPSETLRNRDA